MITNKDGCLWSNSQFPQCKQDGFRVRLGAGDMIRANYRAGSGRQVEPLQDGQGIPFRFVGHNAPGDLMFSQFCQQLDNAGKGPGLFCQVLHVQRQQLLTQGLKIRMAVV